MSAQSLGSHTTLPCEQEVLLPVNRLGTDTEALITVHTAERMEPEKEDMLDKTASMRLADSVAPTGNAF